MTLNEAKFILQVYRPDQNPSDHPGLEEALEFMKSNQKLQAWYEEECIFDKAFSSKLEDILIPPGLGPIILGQVISKPDKIIEFPWWKQFSVPGAAASIILALSLVLLPIRERSFEASAMTVESFQNFANQSLKSGNGFSSRAGDWGSLVQYLDDHNTPAPTSLPGKIDQMPPVGCMTLKFKEKPVGVICFGKNSKSHLFVINSRDFPKMPFKSSPLLNQNPYTTSVYWSENDRHYLLVSHDPKELNEFVSF